MLFGTYIIVMTDGTHIIACRLGVEKQNLKRILNMLQNIVFVSERSYQNAETGSNILCISSLRC